MDVRDTPEQAELRRAARSLASRLGPATVADLDDGARRARLATAVTAAGWPELRDDAGDATPVASGVEAGIVVDALGAAVADVALTGPLLAADLARRAGVTVEAGTAVAFDADLLGPGTAIAVDGSPGATSAVTVDGAHLVMVPVAPPDRGTDLTRVVGRQTAASSGPVGNPLTADDLTAWTALGLALTSADLVGVMRGVLDITVAYARDREQYGTPIGSFQAVQHLLAESWTLMAGSHSVTLHAGWAVDALEPRAALEAARVAKAYTSRAARTVCETAIQVHGGIGNTWECIVHVYLRRALLSTAWFGDDGEQLRALESERWAVTSGLS